MTLDRFLAWADKRNLASVRSFTLYATIWMTWRITVWATTFANAWLASGKSGAEVAMIIAAVTVPLTALQGFAFQSYINSTK